MSYTNTGMWTLEKWCRGTHLQSRSRDTDIENKREDSKEEKEGWDELGDWGRHTHTHAVLRLGENSREPPRQHREPRSALCGDPDGERIRQGGVHTQPTHVVARQKPTQHCKTTLLQEKLKK